MLVVCKVDIGTIPFLTAEPSTYNDIVVDQYDEEEEEYNIILPLSK